VNRNNSNLCLACKHGKGEVIPVLSIVSQKHIGEWSYSSSTADSGTGLEWSNIGSDSRLDHPYRHFWVYGLENVGASTSHNPTDLHGPLQGKFYFFTSVLTKRTHRHATRMRFSLKCKLPILFYTEPEHLRCHASTVTLLLSLAPSKILVNIGRWEQSTFFSLRIQYHVTESLIAPTTAAPLSWFCARLYRPLVISDHVLPGLMRSGGFMLLAVPFQIVIILPQLPSFWAFTSHSCRQRFSVISLTMTMYLKRSFHVRFIR
jgi:hypothetical protein